MMIPVRIKSNSSGRIKRGVITPRRLLEMTGEEDLVEQFTACGCSPIGETYVVECNCDLEWMDYELSIGDEVKLPD